ncbi:hypothetical protein AV530_019777 [Patagioenas fasciata monilis]|uniref:Uncharacterized protein n=1 Tax=Patagioenas fasciata monilis TaxID=372326 RepID=A0A1V4JZK2_PATFA|nr:hypothetical protein AV530_019777 [Patagioenas fasciata monilis]
MPYTVTLQLPVQPRSKGGSRCHRSSFRKKFRVTSMGIKRGLCNTAVAQAPVELNSLKDIVFNVTLILK